MYVLSACYVCIASLSAICDCRSGLQQTMIVGLVFTTSYVSNYGLLADHDYRTGFSASCDISFHVPVYILNHFLVLLRVTTG
jgi:hypothetical protein